MLTEINSLSPINMTYVYVGVDLLGCSLLIYFFFFSSFFSFFHLSTPEHTQKTEEEQTQKNDLTSSRPSRSICLALMSVLQTIFLRHLRQYTTDECWCHLDIIISSSSSSFLRTFSFCVIN